MENYNLKAEENLLKMKKQKEEADKRLLHMEILLGVLCIVPLLISIIIVMAIPMEEWLGVVITVTGLIPLLIATPFAIRIEQVAGYYECEKCHHKYIPKYKSVFLAMHYGRTRYMKCPECNKRSWHKKVISKE